MSQNIKTLEVIESATGQKIVIKSHRFNAELHSLSLPKVKEEVQEEVTAEPIKRGRKPKSESIISNIE